jgi:glycosyltransferase involved in cell wall biosynthesis
MAKIKLTLVTCNFNSGGLLEDTVRSVLGQTLVHDHPDLIEYVVLDAGSTDGSFERVLPLLDRPFIRTIRKPDKGLYDGLANAFAETSGELMAWINAGDVLFPSALSTLITAHVDTGSKWMTGYNSFCNGNAQITKVALPFRYRTAFFESAIHCIKLPTLQQESSCWHRSLLDDFDWERFRSFKLAGDFFLWHHLSRKTLPDIIHSTIGAFRSHHNQLSGDLDRYHGEMRSFCRVGTLPEKILSLVDQIAWRLPDSWKWRLAAPYHIRFSTDDNRWYRLATRG